MTVAEAKNELKSMPALNNEMRKIMTRDERIAYSDKRSELNAIVEKAGFEARYARGLRAE